MSAFINDVNEVSASQNSKACSRNGHLEDFDASQHSGGLSVLIQIH